MRFLFTSSIVLLLVSSVFGASWKTSETRILLVEHDGSVSKAVTVAKGGKLADLTLDHQREIHVAIDLSDSNGEPVPAPQQAFLRLKHESGVSSFLVGTARTNGTISWRVSSSIVSKQIGTYGGPFSAAILLGDAESDKGIRVELGTFKVLHTPLPTGQQPPQPAPQAVLAQAVPKPEIIHAHRAPDKRPPIIFSLVFTGLSLAPLFLLFVHLNSLKANTNGFKGSLVPTGIAFHGLLGAMLVLFGLFWLRLNLMQTLPLVAILGVGIAAAAYFHLNKVSYARAARETKPSKKD